MHILTQYQLETQCPPHFGFPAPIKTCVHLQRDAHVERVVRFVAYLPSAAPAPAAAAAVELTEGLLAFLLGRASAADKAVRFRACQLMGAIFTSLPMEIELSEVGRLSKRPPKWFAQTPHACGTALGVRGAPGLSLCTSG